MARPRTPAKYKKGKSETKEHLEARSKIEEEMSGNTDKLYDVPEVLDDLGKDYYLFILHELEESGILSNLDIPIVQQTADCLSKMDQCDEILNEHKSLLYITYDNRGNEVLKEHPMVGTKQKYLNQFRALCTQLGLSPSSRASLSEAKMQKEKNSEDPLLALLGGD